jgi:S-adenosylmethionine:tRNA ribosyltransferase-isomerase
LSDQNLKNEPYLSLKDFNFEVPESLVAQHPLKERDASKLLVWDGHKISHSRVADLYREIPEGTLFIVNNSRVIASRIHGRLETGGAIELLLLEPVTSETPGGGESWLCLGRPMKKLSRGTKVIFPDRLSAVVTRESTHSGSGPEPFEVKLSITGDALLSWLEDHGDMPLPPYISRKDSSSAVQREDRERYQTVYSEGLGSVAAPTAGLHFTDRVINQLKQKNCSFAHVTLHVGAGTFLPVKTNDPAHHTMHTERFLVPKETLEAISKAKAEGRKVVIVGTTALRSLEGLARLAEESGKPLLEMAGQWQRTAIFIRPSTASQRHKPWCADAMMTNFHQPESTLFMLVCALIGYNAARQIYKDATERGYRFYSYGDSSLLWL